MNDGAVKRVGDAAAKGNVKGEHPRRGATPHDAAVKVLEEEAHLAAPRRW